MPLMKSESPTLADSPSGLKCWCLAARPRTLIAGISPVLLGASCASTRPFLPFLLCLAFSLVLQIATNFANDYFDFIKGVDTPARQGPARAVQSGWIAPRTMRNAAFGAFALAALLALPLLARLGLHYVPLLLLALLCGFFYTGGNKPLGYLGLGDLLAFVFYGPVATCCTALALDGSLLPATWAVALVPGAFSCALLSINNLRDATQDREHGKMTLVARFGTPFGQLEYAACLITASLVPLFVFRHGYVLSLVLLLLARNPLDIVSTKPEELNTALRWTAGLFTLYTLLLCACLYL